MTGCSRAAEIGGWFRGLGVLVSVTLLSGGCVSSCSCWGAGCFLLAVGIFVLQVGIKSSESSLFKLLVNGGEFFR